MMNVVFAAVLLVQATADDPPALTSTIDSAVKGISGYALKAGSKPVADDVFLKRIMRDLVDAAPAAAELKAFVDDPDPKKRAKQINALLEDPRFGPFWADRFSEVFFGEARPVRFLGLGELSPGVEFAIFPAFKRWFGSMLQRDRPWTDIVSGLLDARGSTEGDPSLAYKLSRYRAPGMQQAFAEGVSRHFLGIRLTCARCHDHPYDKWRMEDYYGLAAFAAGQQADRHDGGVVIKYRDSAEIEMTALKNPKSKDIRSVSGTVTPAFLFGQKPGPHEDWMKYLGDYLSDRSTTQLPRELANRVWGWLFGWGVVNPVDDFNMRNKALSPALLEAMTRYLIDNKYSLKSLLRAICNTQEYQLPTPEEAPEIMSFRHLASAKFALGGYTPLDSKKLAVKISFTAPPSWVRVVPKAGPGGTRMLYLLPDREDKTRRAQLWVIEGKTEELNPGQFVKARTATTAVEGRLKFSLMEVTGVYSCRPGADAPLDYSILMAQGEFTSGALTAFRLEGPAAVVAGAREDFLTLLKTASKD
ncbi:MAG: DUF1549 domain-containing protein [Planctomycetes bacterium]|nr:DUF1549 domain-containing protein [Planctomycetota bacterium]